LQKDKSTAILAAIMGIESRASEIRKPMERFLTSITPQEIQELLPRTIRPVRGIKAEDPFQKRVEGVIDQIIDTHYYRYKDTLCNTFNLATEMIQISNPALWDELIAKPNHQASELKNNLNLTFLAGILLSRRDYKLKEPFLSWHVDSRWKCITW